MPTVEQIQQHFIEEVNRAVRRPAMYGPPDAALHLLLMSAAYVTETDGEYGEWRGSLRPAGAWSPIGVLGAVQKLFPPLHTNAVSSVFAEFPHRQGWLRLNRTLSEMEYGGLGAELVDYCAEDHVLAQVLERFGEPSLWIGGGGRYPCVLGYATAHDPIVWFYLWNGSNPGEPESWPVFEEPVLLAVRCGLAPFEECFTFTPEGARRRPEPYDPWAGMLDD